MTQSDAKLLPASIPQLTLLWVLQNLPVPGPYQGWTMMQIQAACRFDKYPTKVVNACRNRKWLDIEPVRYHINITQAGQDILHSCPAGHLEQIKTAVLKGKEHA